MNLNTQLNFGGNCEEAFRFYETHLGGMIEMMMTQSQATGVDGHPRASRTVSVSH